jgi:hypothetical protein
MRKMEVKDGKDGKETEVKKGPTIMERVQEIKREKRHLELLTNEPAQLMTRSKYHDATAMLMHAVGVSFDLRQIISAGAVYELGVQHSLPFRFVQRITHGRSHGFGPQVQPANFFALLSRVLRGGVANVVIYGVLADCLSLLFRCAKQDKSPQQQTQDKKKNKNKKKLKRNDGTATAAELELRQMEESLGPNEWVLRRRIDYFLAADEDEEEDEYYYKSIKVLVTTDQVHALERDARGLAKRFASPREYLQFVGYMLLWADGWLTDEVFAMLQGPRLERFWAEVNNAPAKEEVSAVVALVDMYQQEANKREDKKSEESESEESKSDAEELNGKAPSEDAMDTEQDDEEDADVEDVALPLAAKAETRKVQSKAADSKKRKRGTDVVQHRPQTRALRS